MLVLPASGSGAPNAGKDVSARSASYEGGDDVGGVPVEGLAAPVVAHRGARVGVAGRFLHITQWHTGVQGGGDEGVTQGVRSDALGDVGAAGDAPDEATGGVPIQAGVVGVDEDRSLEPFADSQIDGAGDAWRQRHRDELAALAQHRQGAVPAFLAESFDVGADRLRHPQTVQRQQGHQGVIEDNPAATRMAPSSLRSRWATCDA